MSLEGGTIKDLLPVPDNFEAINNPDHSGKDQPRSLHDGSTISHSLAVADHDEKGHAQVLHDDEVKDLGWNESEDQVPKPLVGGLPNEELWLLLRRFNKQVYDVKAVTKPVAGGLDLNIADEEEFSPDKLRASIERLYMTVM